MGAPTGRWQMVVVYRGKHDPLCVTYLAALQVGQGPAEGAGSAAPVLGAAASSFGLRRNLGSPVSLCQTGKALPSPPLPCST